MLEIIQTLDQAIVVFGQPFWNPLTDLFFGGVTLLGHPAFWLVVATVLYWNKRERAGFWLVNVVVLAVAIAGILKLIFARPRPDANFYITSEPSWLSALSNSFINRFSFPSGHATTIAAVVTHYWHGFRTRRLKTMGVLAVVLVGVSRIALGAHFLSDVIAGIGLGVLMGKIVTRFSAALTKHHFKLSKLEDTLSFVVVIATALLAMLWLEPPALALGVLGYYAGFFLAKEIELEQTKLKMQGAIIKTFLGLVLLGVIMALSIFGVMGTVQLTLFFIAGFWVSFLFPFLFEKTLLKSNAHK